MNPLVIVQARLGSQRLPSKVLMDIGGRTCLRHVMERVQMAGYPYILTVPADPGEYALYRYARDNGWPVSRGPHPDMVFAFLTARNEADVDAYLIVRVTADCPFIQPDDIHRYATAISDPRMDAPSYASNAHPVRHVPKGLDVEALTYDGLLDASMRATEEERHHITPYMRRILGLATSTDDGEFRVTLDTEEDLAVLRHIAGTINIEPPHPTLDELRAYFRAYTSSNVIKSSSTAR